MTPERHRQIGELFDAALKLVPGRRHAFLDQACGEDPGLRREVESLLASHEQAGEFIATPALEVAAIAMDTNHSMMTLASGTHLGPYEILSLIGVGGMGEVYKASDTRLNRAVAVKVLPAHFSQNLEMKQRLEREARTIAGLNHPHICTLYDVGHQDGTDFLVMEFLEGETLAERLERGALPLEDALKVAMEVAGALEKAHRQGVVHRDLKPSNVMLTEGGAKLLDFGLAKLKHERLPAGTLSALRTNASMTATGMILGTLEYLSPEQLEGKEADARTDIFAFGATVYEMVTGKKAFEGKTHASLIAAILDRDPAPISSVQPRTPAHFDRIVMRCLAKDPEERWQTASNIQHELKWLPGEPQSAAAVQTTNSIAVLPFVNMSADRESEYLSDGIAEELLNSLSKVRDLKVVARTSSFQFKGRSEDVRRIGEILGVRTVLEGSIRKAGGDLRIAVRLINVADGFQLWSEIYSREFKEVFAIEQDIAQSVADALQIKLRIAPASAPQTRNLDAFQFNLKGRYELGLRTTESLRKAVEYFEEAVRRDPAYALAHAGVAEANALLAAGGYATADLDKLSADAQRAVSRAVALDPSLAEAHAALAIVKFRIDWNWNDCEREFRLAIKLNPSFASAHHWFALYLAAMGRFDEAVDEIQRAQELDPLSLIISTAFARVLHFAGRYDEAIEKCRSVLDMEPEFEQAHLNLGLACLEKSDFPEALRALDKAVTLSRGRALFSAVLGHAYARAGKRSAAVKVLKTLDAKRHEDHVPALCYAIVYAALGRKDEAVEHFRQALQERDGPVVYIKVEPLYASLHSHPGFAGLLSMMNLSH